MGYLQHLGGIAVPRMYIQDMRCAHERVSLVHVDVPDAATQTHLVIEVDRLHEYTRAHVVQERMLVARAHERRIRESVRAREFGEGQLGPWSEVAQRCVSVVHRRGKRRREPLCLVRRRMACHLALNNKIVREAPDFPAAIHALKHEISVLVVAVSLGANVILENQLSTSTTCGQVGVGWEDGVVRGLALSPGEDSIGERQRRDGSRRAHPICEL